MKMIIETKFSLGDTVYYNEYNQDGNHEYIKTIRSKIRTIQINKSMNLSEYANYTLYTFETFGSRLEEFVYKTKKEALNNI